MFTNNVEAEVGQMDISRVQMVRNQTLAQHSANRRLGDFLLSQSFDSRIWVPKTLGVSLETSVSQKTLADLAEATMGAGLMAGGINGALHIARCLGITPPAEQSVEEMGKLYRQQISVIVLSAQLDQGTPRHIRSELEQFLGYNSAMRFFDPRSTPRGVHGSVSVIHLQL
ncbi:hypothetical protein A4X13_0g8460 [Tilletia indica]|uniref:Uncharacterized protein n=1 Tax=Tilletia indica TaxID=43049 RepID=A0A177TQ42_9BASI|nr:hypothetical protein A4X13_0g8460 [Tilletia indica]